MSLVKYRCYECGDEVSHRWMPTSHLCSECGERKWWKDAVDRRYRPDWHGIMIAVYPEEFNL